MKFRQISIVVGIGLIAGAFMLNKYLAGLKKDPEKKPKTERVQYVKVLAFSKDTVQNAIEVTGRLLAKNSIQVIAEVQGKYLPVQKEFREAEAFTAGEVMIAIAPAEMTMNFKAQKSTFLNALIQLLPDLKIDFSNEAAAWEQYVSDFDIDKDLPALPEVEDKKLKLFLNSRSVYTSFYNLKATEITLSKYLIKAPFSGVVSTASISLGMLVRPGQVLGTFMDPKRFEIEFALAEADLQMIQIGDRFEAEHPYKGDRISGKIVRKAEYIDPNTQTVKVFALLEASDLKEGMYLSGVIRAGEIPNALKIDRKLLLNRNEVYVVEDGRLRLKQITVHRIGPDYAIIGGLEDGDRLLNQSLNGAFEGMNVNS